MSSNAVIYCRISSPNQSIINNIHLSIEHQLMKCKTYCEINDMNILEELSEIKSARNMSNLHKLIYILNTYSNINLIIYNITRFSRNILQGLQYIDIAKKKNIIIHFVEESVETNHHLDLHRIRLGLSQSEYESDTISKRVKANNIVLKNKGWCFGPPKYGQEVIFRKGIRRFRQCNYERKIIRFIIIARQGRCSVMALNKLLQNIIPNNTVPIEFYDMNSNSAIIRFDKPYTLTFGEIANLLNSYEIKNRHNYWTSTSLGRVYNNNNINIQKKFSSMNI